MITTEAWYIWKTVDRGGENKKSLFHEENNIDDITNSIADECFNFFFLGNISQITKRFSQWTLLMLNLFIFYEALN